MSNLQFLPAWPPHPDALFYITLVFAVATLVGEILFRLLRIPRIVGYALIGLGAGALNLSLEGFQPLESLRIVIDIALAVLLFELGCRVSFKWLRANPWLLLSSLLEAGLTAGAVYFMLTYFGCGKGAALAVACAATCTSPAVSLWVMNESGARGQITDRLLMLTALNTIYALLATKIVIAYLLQEFRGDVLAAILHPVYLISGSFLLAVILAAGVRFLNRRFDLRQEQSALLLFAFLLVVISLVTLAELSSLLVALLAGMALRHQTDRPLLWPRHFGTAGGVLVVMLFVLMGMTLRVDTLLAGDLMQAGLLGLALIGVRLVAKIMGVLALSEPSGISPKQAVALGLALAPMSGVALAITLEFRDALPELDTNASAIVFSAIAVLIVFGPLLTRQALRWVGEINS